MTPIRSRAVGKCQSTFHRDDHVWKCARPKGHYGDHVVGDMIWANEVHAFPAQLDPDTRDRLVAGLVPPVFSGNEQTDSPHLALERWWLQQARVEIEKTAPKAVEYGSTDLADIGHDLARVAGRTVTDEEATELGIFFYIRGKLARWIDAVIRGDRPSDDTLFDLGVYVRMAQRNRVAGGWPGTEKE